MRVDVKMAAVVLDPTDVPVSTVLLDRSAREVSHRYASKVHISSSLNCVDVCEDVRFVYRLRPASRMW